MRYAGVVSESHGCPAVTNAEQSLLQLLIWRSYERAGPWAEAKGSVGARSGGCVSDEVSRAACLHVLGKNTVRTRKDTYLLVWLRTASSFSR